MTKEHFNLFVKIGLVGAVALVVSPIIFLVVKGIAGVAAALALAAILNALVPAFSSWLTHVKYKSLQYVISREPVLELVARAKERWDALDEQSKLLTEQAATLERYKKKALQTARNFPEEAEELNKNMKQYEELFAYRVEAFKGAKRDTEQFMRTVDKAEAMYEMACADAALGKSFGKNRDFMAVFREKTAFDAIDKASATSLANLRMALVDNDYAAKVETPAHAVAYSPTGQVVLGNVLDMSAVKVPVLKGEA